MKLIMTSKMFFLKTKLGTSTSTKLDLTKKKRKQADEEEEKGCDADGSETAQSSPVKSR